MWALGFAAAAVALGVWLFRGPKNEWAPWAVGVFFLVDLVMATQGGLDVYHLLLTYISTWPSLLTSLLTLAAALLCLGPHSLLSSLVDMSKVRLPHVVISHLSVLYTSLVPVLLLASLASSLHLLAGYGRAQPLQTFDIFLPEWAVSTGWSLALLPTSPVIFGAIVYLIWADRGTPRLAVTITCNWDFVTGSVSQQAITLQNAAI